ncbi:MAG: MinD/ParA family protein [Deltaproteobacteria bacterium]|nr:MinD/ParA family protein [Deltaproteobacteria bacterium]
MRTVDCGVKRNPPNVIAITSGKGGVGKTNVVANLAVSLAMMDMKVLVLDADLGLGNLDVLLGLTPRFNLGHLLRGERTLDEVVIRGPKGIRILPAASGINELTSLGPAEKLSLFTQIEGFGDDVDIMLIDTAAGISQNVLFFNIAARETIVVASPEPTSIVDAYALMKVLHLKHGEKRFRLLINSVRNSKEGLEVYKHISRVALRYLSVSMDYLGFIPFDEFLPKAVRGQMALVELFPDSRAAKAFRDLAGVVRELPPSEPKDNVQFFLGRFTQAG